MPISRNGRDCDYKLMTWVSSPRLCGLIKPGEGSRRRRLIISAVFSDHLLLAGIPRTTHSFFYFFLLAGIPRTTHSYPRKFNAQVCLPMWFGGGVELWV